MSTADKTVVERLTAWLENPPDYYDVRSAYNRLGELRQLVRRLRGVIRELENDVVKQSTKPRSNETRILKIEATETYQKNLDAAESDLEQLETYIKLLEYQRSMFTASTYALKTVEGYSG